MGLGWTAGKVSVGTLVQKAVDQGIEADDMQALRFWALCIAGAAVAVGICTGIRRYLAFREARWIEADLREQLFAHFQRLHFGFHDRTQTGQLMSRANTDLQQIQAFVVMIPLTISNGVTVLAVTVILLRINAILAVLALGSLPFMNVLATRFSRRLHPAVMGIQQESAELAAVVEETVAGVRVVKGFGAESVQAARLKVEADDVFEQSMEAARVRATYLPALELLPNIGLIATLGYGGHQVLDGHLTIGELVAFNVYVVMLIWPLRMLGMIIAQGQRSAASAERVHEVLVTDPDIAEPSGACSLPAVGPAGGRGEVRFDGVRFTYGSQSPVVLDGFDLVVPAGQSIALVGATGSGKTTVARLIPRFYDVAAGSVSLDGVDVRTLRLRDLRKAVGIVFEETFLFSDTIGANIAFADPSASLDDVRAGRPPGRGRRVHHRPPRGLRHHDRRAGLLAVGGPAAAHRHRPGDPRRPAGADPRRRHVVGGSHQGARDPRRARRGDAGPHDARDRPPPGHHRAGRSRGPDRRRTCPRRRHPRRAAAHEPPPTARSWRRPSAARPTPPASAKGWPDHVDAGRSRRREPPRRLRGAPPPPPHLPDAAAVPPRHVARG